MPTFTPPGVADKPPVSAADQRFGPDTALANPLGARLFSFYGSRRSGVNVFKMSDGTYRVSQPVAGLAVQAVEPYPATTADLVPNGVLAESWYNGQPTVFPLPSPHVTVVYYGAHSYPVSSTEAAELTAAGFGAYLT